MAREYLCTACYRTSGVDGESNYCQECQSYKYFDWVELEDYEDKAKLERERIVKLIERQICFDALADSDGRCSNHGGKCYELRQLIESLTKGETNG
jgi:hypothetical protein